MFPLANQVMMHFLAVAHAAPRVWNSLPQTIIDDLNISAPVLTSRLKTFLYTSSYQ